MPWKIGLSALAILSLTAISAHTGSQDSAKAGEATKQPEVQVRGPIVGTVVMVDMDEQATLHEIKEYLDVQFYLNVVYPEQQAVEAYLWAIAHPPPPVRAPSPVRIQTYVTGSGDCAGVAAIIGGGTVTRESGWNPLAENGIYKGCGQIGLPWWNGACAGLDWHNTDDQTKCARIVMDIQGPSAWRETYSPN